MGALLHIITYGNHAVASEASRPAIQAADHAPLTQCDHGAVFPRQHFVIRIVYRADYGYSRQATGYPGNDIRGPKMTMDEIGPILPQPGPQFPNSGRQIARSF